MELKLIVCGSAHSPNGLNSDYEIEGNYLSSLSGNAVVGARDMLAEWCVV